MVECLFSPIFQHSHSIVEWSRENKVMHVRVYLFLYKYRQDSDSDLPIFLGKV